MNKLLLKHSIKTLLFWLFVFGFLNAESQNYFDSYIKNVKLHQDAKVDSLINLSLIDKQPKEAIKIAHDFSVKNYRKRDYEKALVYALMEVEIFEKASLFDKNYINAIYNVAFFYYKNYEYRKSIELHEKVIEKDTFNIKAGRSYAEIGRAYNKLGNYHKSISYYKKGVEIIKKNKSYRSLITHYINFSTVYNNIGTDNANAEALKILKRADSLVTLGKVKIRNYNSLQDALATQYTYTGNYDFKKAKHYYTKNLKSLLQKGDSSALSRAYNNLANLYLIEKNDSAEYFIKQGLSYATNNYIKVQLYDNNATFYKSKNSLSLALQNAHKALEISIGRELDVLEAIELKQLVNLQLPDVTVSRLKDKIQILTKLYDENSERKYLEAILKNVKAVDELTDFIQSTTTSVSTKMVWRREASQAYLYGAYAAHLLSDVDLTFAYMEKSKAILLSEGVLKNTKFQNLPKHITDKETDFRKYIYKLENQLASKESKEVQDSLFNAKLRYEKYIDSLKVQFPEYFDRKLNVTQVPLPEVQKDLKENEVVISYIWNQFDEEKEIVLGLVAAKTGSSTFEIPHIDSLRLYLNSYKKRISQPFTTQEDQQRYQKIAYKLYTELIPEKLRVSMQGKSLMIIPDGNLQEIPFESLITKPNSNLYLVLDHNISYAYSYSFSKYNEKRKRVTNQKFIGFAPVMYKNQNLLQLNETKKEVEAIHARISGVIELDNSATKRKFLETSSTSKIIHLATHADAGENPWIAFSDEKLNMHELYTYQNNADLVTLSACNTSLGEIAKGEGVMSLARGFFYSGSKSVVSSLWKANDGSTSEIMTNFYQNLKEGQTKIVALNNAKRKYLESHALSEQSPFYWSSFILIGDTSTIDLTNDYLLYYIFAAGTLLILFFRKKIKNRG